MDTLFYFSKSADKKPGKGVNEFVKNLKDYEELSQIKDWRKILSNFYVAPFKYNGKTWNTIEHAFQSKKIELVDEKLAEKFTLESGDGIGRGGGLVARKNRKLVILDEDQLKHWNDIKSGIMEEILFEKFSQNELCKKVLLATNEACLLHSTGRGVSPVKQYGLENVRKRVKNM